MASAVVVFNVWNIMHVRRQNDAGRRAVLRRIGGCARVQDLDGQLKARHEHLVRIGRECLVCGGCWWRYIHYHIVISDVIVGGW